MRTREQILLFILKRDFQIIEILLLQKIVVNPGLCEGGKGDFLD